MLENIELMSLDELILLLENEDIMLDKEYLNNISKNNYINNTTFYQKEKLNYYLSEFYLLENI